MTAGVHDTVDLGREVEAGVLGDGESIDIGSCENGRSGAVVDDGDQTGGGDPGDLEAESLEFGRDAIGGLVLVEADLRIAVKVFLDLALPVELGIDGVEE